MELKQIKKEVGPNIEFYDGISLSEDDYLGLDKIIYNLWEEYFWGKQEYQK